jgi:miniconductance mechanosensitive channel
MLVINSFIDAWHAIYNMLPISQHRHIKGYVQLVKIFVYLIAGLIVVSVIFRKEVSTLVAGLGAMAAVLILVFKDTLLGLVASIQLSANKMLKVGDWITIPGRDVDGNVTDITLNTVKVQNFDRTIVTVPTYSLVNESFQNWEGMLESGSRRIKRAFSIDMRSIRFADTRIKEEFVALMKELSPEEAKKTETLFPEKEKQDANVWFRGGAPTNLGYFRYYAEVYMKKHPCIDSSQSVILRHREPVGNGLPLQVYAFASRTDFFAYENTQSEIFEHLIAVMNRFGLKVYQQPTGDDILELTVGVGK